MKKILAILGMITCMIGLAACGSAEKAAETATGPLTEDQALILGAQTVENMNIIFNSGDIEKYVEDEIGYNGLLNFASAMEDIGNYLGTDGGTVEFQEDGMIVRINVKGSDHSAVVEIILDGSLNYTSIATNVNYTFGEKMEKAALNTLLGMGTVFVVLILISVIIALFGFIPKLTAKKKETKPQEEKAGNVVAQIVEKEELSDDLELVAVISAAIAAYEGSGSTDGFVVRSIRKAYKK